MKWSADVKKNEDKDVGLPEEMTKKGQRSDIQLDQRLRTVHMFQPKSDVEIPQSEMLPPSKVSETAPTMVICGTDVSVVPCKAKLRKFVETWVDSEPDTDKQMTRRDNNAPTYMQILAEIASIQNPFLEVNCGHIENFDTDLYSQLICYPQEVIHTFDMAVNELFLEKFPGITLTHEIKVRLYSADKTKNMRTLGPEDINKLITITGLVTRASDFVTEMTEAVFRCSVCHSVCSSNHSCSLVHNRSRFSDKLLMQLQESPDSIPAGQIPHTKVMLVPGYVMEDVQPGDRVSVTGVFRAFPMRPSPIVRNIGSVYKTHIDVVYIRKTDKGKENEDIKKSILLQALPNKTTCWSPQDLAHYKLNAYFSNKVEEAGFYVFDPQYYQNTEPFRESLQQATGITDNTHLVSEYFKMYPDIFKFTYHSAYIASISKQPGDFDNCTSTTVSNVIVCMKKTDNPRKTQFDGKQRPDVPSTENPGIRACANSEQVDQEEEEILLQQFGQDLIKGAQKDARGPYEFCGAIWSEDSLGSEDPNFINIPQFDGPNDPPDVAYQFAENNLPPGGQSPRGQPLPVGRRKQKAVKDNHFYEVKRVFFVDNAMMVELDITFFQVAADPQRHLKKHNVIIPREEIENLRIKSELQDRLVGKAIFIKDIHRYSRQLLADIQEIYENVPDEGNNITEVLRFECPSIFVVENVVYYCSGIDCLFRLSRPTKKLDENERKQLKFVVFYSGPNKEFVDSEETLVRGICDIVGWFNKQQPNTRDHAWIWVYIARVVQGKLYKPLVKRYPQTTTFVTSGKQTRCAKSLAGSTLNLVANGEDMKGGKFKEAQVFKKIVAGEEYIVDEMTSLPPAMKKDVVTVVQHLFQRLYRAVGKGGYPNAVLFIHCNIEPRDFNFEESDRSKMCFIDVGRTQTGQVKGVKESPKELHKKIISTAENLHQYYPNLLSIGVECFFDPITDQEMRSIAHIVGDDDRKGQDVINALKFIYKMKDLAKKYNIEPPNSLISEPDIRCITEAFTRTKCAEDLLNWVDEQGLLEGCELATCDEQEGVRIPASDVSLSDVPRDLHSVISACPYPSTNGRRWRFVAFQQLTTSMVERVKMALMSICGLWCEEAQRMKKSERKIINELISAAAGQAIQQEEEDANQNDVNTAGSSNDQGIPCNYCDRSFKSSRGLKVHMNKHK